MASQAGRRSGLRVEYQWPLVGLLAVVAFVLGFLGFRAYTRATGESPSAYDLVYLTLQLFTLRSGAVHGPLPWTLEVARLLAPAVVTYTAIKALVVIFRDQIDLLRLRFFRHHVVVCGLGQKGLMLSRSFRARGERVVAVEIEHGNENIALSRNRGVVVLDGNARDPDQLRRAGVARARLLFAVCADDDTNAEIAVQASRIAEGRSGRALTGFVHIAESDLAHLLREEQIEEGEARFTRLEFFNIFESGARALLHAHPAFAEDAGPVTLPPRVLVVGVSTLAWRVVAHAARLWRTLRPETGARLFVTWIGPGADGVMDLLRTRHPDLAATCSLEGQALDLDSAEFLRGGFLFAADGRCQASAIYVCPETDAESLSAALALRRSLAGCVVPIVAVMKQEGGLGSLLRQDEGGTDGVRVFGLLDHLALVAQRRDEDDVVGLEILVERETAGSAARDDYLTQAVLGGTADERMPFENVQRV